MLQTLAEAKNMELKVELMLQEKGWTDYSFKMYTDQYKAIAGKDNTTQSQGNQVHTD